MFNKGIVREEDTDREKAEEPFAHLAIRPINMVDEGQLVANRWPHRYKKEK